MATVNPIVVSGVTGDGLAVPFVQYNLMIPGANTVPVSISGGIQGVLSNPQYGGGGNAGVQGTYYPFATAALGTIGPSAVTMWCSFQAQMTSGTVSMLTSTVAYPTVATGYSEFFRIKTNGEASPAAATVMTMITSW